MERPVNLRRKRLQRLNRKRSQLQSARNLNKRWRASSQNKEESLLVEALHRREGRACRSRMKERSQSRSQVRTGVKAEMSSYLTKIHGKLLLGVQILSQSAKWTSFTSLKRSFKILVHWTVSTWPCHRAKISCKAFSRMKQEAGSRLLIVYREPLS